MLVKKVKICNLQQGRATTIADAGGNVWFYDSDDNRISTGTTLISSTGITAETELVKIEAKSYYNGSYVVYNAFNTNASADITSVSLYATASFANTDKSQYFQCEFKTATNIDYLRYNMSTNNKTMTKEADIEITFANGIIKTIHVTNENSEANHIVRIKMPSYDVNDTIVKTTDNNNLKNLNNIFSIRVDSYEDSDTIIKYAMSVDNRNTWKIFKDGNWNTINLSALKISGNTTNELINITTENLSNFITNGSSLDFIILLGTNNERTSPILKKIEVIVNDLLDPSEFILYNDY